MPDAGDGYSGDVTVERAFQALSSEAEATLIDVRTSAEWSYVGVPSLEAIGKSPILIEWQTFPSGARVSDFTSLLSAELEQRGIGKEAPLYFICRSGSRSRAAAIAMTAAGYTNCFNVGPGFEGPLDGDGHRNTVSGWRVSGLPWSQT
jgi:rhodanese-related sulfurtransferase